MISVVIPLMPIEPYRTQVWDCVRSLRKQDVDVDLNIIVQQESSYISKNTLLNHGIRESSGEYVFFCDADFVFDDTTTLRRMRNKVEDGFEVIFPMYLSPAHKNLKIADGGVFTTRKTIERHGKLDESLEGISWVTFPFLKWCQLSGQY